MYFELMIDIKDLVEIIKINGFIGTIYLFVIISVGFVIYKYGGKALSKAFNAKIDKIFKKTSNNDAYSVKEISESDIINHELFTYIDFWCYSKIPTIEFSTEYRSVVFKKYLTILFKSYKINIKDFVVNKTYHNKDESELKSILLRLINDVIFDYETEMRKTDIPDVIIRKMKNKNNDTLNLIHGMIEGICDSHFYNSDKNLLKMFSVLNIILSVMENIVANSQPVCDSINGELRGFSMDGKTEPASSH